MSIAVAGAAGVDAAEGTEPRAAGMRLAGSYVNFYIGSRRIVAPLLDPRRDAAALRKLKSLFPTRALEPMVPTRPPTTTVGSSPA